MMGTRALTVLMALLMLMKSELIANDEECDLLQYLTIGRNGTIQCSFSEYHAVSWFNIEEDTTILFYEKGVIPEDGYASDDYDIYPNGSLFIRNVTLEHETMFRVTKVISLSKPIVSYEIRVRTIVPPLVQHPVIEHCQDNLTVCYAIQDDSSALSCFVQNVRPRISLVWNQREADRDKPLTSELTIESRNNETFTSRSTVQISTKFPLLSVFVCSAEENAWLLKESETVVVLEKEGPGRISETRKQYIELHTTMFLQCTTSEVLVIVWKRMVDTKTTEEVILLRVKTWKSDFIETYDNDFRLNLDGSLLLRNTEWHHQGRYTCLVAEHTPEELHIDVVIFVMPVPRYLKIAGCDFQRYCVLKVNQGDVLTCSVHGIRPEVNLAWRVYEPNTKVSFLQENHRVQPSGDNYDITLTSTITFTPTTEKRVTVECRVVGTNADIFNLSQTIDLQIPNVQAYSNNTGVLTALVTVTTIVFIIVILVIGGIILRKVIHSNDSQEGGNLEEATPMMSTTDENKEEELINQLKRKYEILYDAVQPIPYIKDRMYCVDKVFVEGGIEYHDKTTVAKQGHEWKQMNSYNELMDGNRMRSTRKILEGEPGYGKSTLTLQLLYDWCQGVPDSPLKQIKILILLRLRQLGGITSIFKAVRQFILPGDSKLTDDDVKSVIENCSSVMLVLDGYDEYPDQDKTNSDVYKIIKNDIFRDITVILTTRSSYLPNYLSSQTDRARLTGFDDLARDKYIRKAVTGDDNEAVDEIRRKLQENPVLGDICEVPLFFVMFAHITHENQGFQKFNSVTDFFRFMISCFHSHMSNKMKDENVTPFQLFESEHSKLDEIAFNALSGKDQQIVWQKQKLCKALGKDFYDKYVRIGILVEEEVLDMLSMPDSMGEMRSTVEVRFYHKLFCEWYAAHHLTKKILKRLSNTSALLANLDPFDLQYVYRFACGLNKAAARKIIKHLQKTNEGQKFAMLCILEQEGDKDELFDSVTEMVSNNVTVNVNDSKLLQRSVTQILEFASKKEIPITSVYLNKSFKHCEEDIIVLHSGLRLNQLLTVEKVHIEAEEVNNEPRILTVEDVTMILRYGLRSEHLKELSFTGCTLPLSISPESLPVGLKSRDMKVCWSLLNREVQLNVQCGQWQVEDKVSLRQICSENVVINNRDSCIQQCSTIISVQTASYHDIPISCLYLKESFSKIDAGDVILHSGLRLSCPVLVKKVVIRTRRRREMTETEVVDILTFVQQSRMLEELEFDGCLLPLTFSSKSIPSELQFRKIKVSWSNYGYSLDLQSGIWKVNEDEVRKLCTQDKFIRRDDSELLQRCTTQFLENASNHHIPISSLNLYKSVSKIDAGDVILHSGLRLSCPASVKKVVISTYGEGTEMTETEVVDILMFVQQSHMLEELEFQWCLLPQSIPAESIPSILKSRNVKVSWEIGYGWLELNLQSVRWMHRYTSHEITDTEYNEKVIWFQSHFGHTKWQKARLAAETE